MMMMVGGEARRRNKEEETVQNKTTAWIRERRIINIFNKILFFVFNVSQLSFIHKRFSLSGNWRRRKTTSQCK
jgi:hypothetical protein